MSNWYYYNENGEKIEVTVKELKELAAQGTITPGTGVESNTGHTGLARAVKGLTFLGAVQSTETENILENLEQKDFERLQSQQERQWAMQSVPSVATTHATANLFPPPLPPPIIDSSKRAALPLSVKQKRTALVWPILATVIVFTVAGALLFSGNRPQGQQPQPAVAKNAVFVAVPVEQPINELEPALEQNEEPVNEEKPEVVTEKELATPFTAEEQTEIDKFITEHGKDVKATDENGRTLLHKAVGNGNVTVTKYLVSAGADIHAKDKNDMTPLHLAARYGPIEITKFLISQGANLNTRDGLGRLPLHVAAEFGHIEVVKFLISEGTDVDVRIGGDWTTLHSAASGGNVELVKFLVSQGLNVNAKRYCGRTPLDEAKSAGHPAVVEYLISVGGRSVKDASVEESTLPITATISEPIEATELRQQFVRAIKQAKIPYREELEKELTLAKNRGELKTVLAISQELKHVVSEDGINLTSFNPEKRILLNAKVRFKKDLESALANYQKQLQQLIKSFVQTDRVDEAKIVQETLDHLSIPLIKTPETVQQK